VKVEVRLFAMLRERAGCDSVTVDVPEGATVRQALDAVGARHGLGELLDAMPVVMAVNRDYATDDVSLRAGDELALIPPVSGGEQATTEFESGPGYDDFMRLVGGHVPKRPGYTDLLGMRPLHIEPGVMRWEFTVGEELLNPVGVIQGGFLTAMLDESMGPAALASLGPGHAIPTLDLTVSFLRPARAGRLVGEGRVVQLGKTVAFLEGTLTDHDDELVARATATARVVKLG
jgi:molybdopterin converting factor subunit 1